MARSVAVAFVLTAKDLASDTLKKGAEGFKGLGEGALHLEAALELAKRGFDVLKEVIGQSIETALQFQSAGVRDQFEQFRQSIDVLRARFGDAFIPVLQTFMAVLKPIITELTNWLTVNNKMIAGKILEWTIELGRVLVAVVLEAVILVAQAWVGWLEIIDVVKAGVDKFVGLVISGFDDLVQGAAAVANAFGMRDTATKLTQFHMQIAALGPAWSAAGDDALRSAQMTAQGFELLKGKVKDIEAAANAAFDKATVIGLQKIGAFATGANESFAEMQARMQVVAEIGRAMTRIDLTITPPKAGSLSELQAEASDAAAKLGDLRTQFLALTPAVGSTDQQIAEASKAVAILTEKAKPLEQVYTKAIAELDKRFQQFAQSAETIGAAFGVMFGKIATGAASTRDAMKRMITAVVDSLKKLALDYLITGMTAALAENSGTSPWGWIAGIAAASALFAFGDQYIARMATGGFVRGYGVSDTVPAWLTPGEYVMTRREVDQGRPDWQKPGAAQGSGDVTVILQSDTLVPETGASFQRRAAPIVDVVRQYAQLGLLQASPQTTGNG